jgi:Papain-like cysteine protease AvrRpt2
MANRLMELQDEITSGADQQTDDTGFDDDSDDEYSLAPSAQAESLAFARPISYRVPGSVPVVSQPGSMNAWAALAAMMLSWREHHSLSIEDALGTIGPEWVDRFKRNAGLPSEDKASFLAAAGLAANPPMKYAPEDWERALRENGPLWVTDDERAGKLFSPRGYLLLGINGTGRGRGTRVDVIDPHKGIQVRERLRDFVKRFVHPGAPRAYPRLQVLHLQQAAPNSNGTGNGSAPAVVSAPAQPPMPVTGPPPPVAAQSYYGARAFSPVEAIALGYEIAKDFAPSAGDITYDLEKLDGTRSPQDDPKWEKVGQWQRGVYHVRSGWLETVLGDEQSAEFDLEWSFNGHCVRDIRIKPTKTNDAWGWKLNVKQTIVARPDQDKTTPDAIAAVEVTFIYTHSHPVYEDKIFHETLIVYGNGTAWHSGKWTQG